MNYARRFGDPEIGLYMPYSQVKTILLRQIPSPIGNGATCDCSGQDSRNRNRDYIHKSLSRQNHSRESETRYQPGGQSESETK